MLPSLAAQGGYLCHRKVVRTSWKVCERKVW
jgi:hypothetical protein